MRTKTGMRCEKEKNHRTKGKSKSRYIKESKETEGVGKENRDCMEEEKRGDGIALV
jgi:hypothetical protein